jgi:hypothetical protein
MKTLVRRRTPLAFAATATAMIAALSANAAPAQAQVVNITLNIGAWDNPRTTPNITVAPQTINLSLVAGVEQTVVPIGTMTATSDFAPGTAAFDFQEFSIQSLSITQTGNPTVLATGTISHLYNYFYSESTQIIGGVPRIVKNQTINPFSADENVSIGDSSVNYKLSYNLGSLGTLRAFYFGGSATSNNTGVAITNLPLRANFTLIAPSAPEPSTNLLILSVLLPVGIIVLARRRRA